MKKSRKKKHIELLPIILGLTIASTVQSQTVDHPNIIYVFPDQFRNCAMNFWNELPYSEHVRFKADPVQTPNLDAFANEAVVFTSAQSNCPLSSPHRGMLLTGMYPDGSGVSLNCNETRPVSNLRIDAITISDVLNHNGYDCAYFGKLHVDYPTPNDPEHPGQYVATEHPVWDAYTPPERRHGFTYWYSYGTFDEHKTPHYWDTEGKRHNIHEWSPQHEADKVIEYLNDHKKSDKPFFIMVGMNPPHSPYQSLNDCMEQDYDLYRDIPLSQLLIRPNINQSLTKKESCAPFYFASLTGVDRQFGRILETLKTLGLDKNTIVVFSSDHGETMASHVEDPKNSPYVEAMNVPFMVRYSEKLKPHVTDLLLSSPDIMPTLLSLAGFKSEIPSMVEGTDWSANLISTKPLKNAPKAVLYIKNTDGDTASNGKVVSYFPLSRGVKTDRYTLALTIDRKTKRLKNVMLFDDVNDPYQMHNLSVRKNKKLFKSLCRLMPNLLKQANDPWYRERILSDIISYK